jgi:hypothetical protein
MSSTVFKEKRPLLTITTVKIKSYLRRDRMLKIGRIPKKLQKFFKPLRGKFYDEAWAHFWALTMALTVCHRVSINSLSQLLRGSTHRTNHGEFLWRSHWQYSPVMQQIAWDMLLSLYRKEDSNLFFILDDTQTIKRSKKMEGVGKFFHHATKRYVQGHTILKVCLYYGGVTIPWASLLYVKKNHAAELEIPFKKLTELAAEAIDAAAFPACFRVYVLFDAFYLCSKVVAACKRRDWRFISVGAPNRCFWKGSVKYKLGKYGRNVLKREGKAYSIQGLRKCRTYRLAERIGRMNGLGEVKIVFSRRKGESHHVALVTDDLHASRKNILSRYLKRWSIEMLIKDEKQCLGLGDYHVRRYQAIVRHLCLVDVAYACLTHLGIHTQRAQGQKNAKNALRLPSISKLKEQMRHIVWRDQVQDVIKHTHDKAVIRRLEKLVA